MRNFARNNNTLVLLLVPTVWQSSRALWLILNTSVCRVYCIVTGSCRPFKRSTQKRYVFQLYVDVRGELFVAVVCEQLSW